MQDDGKARIITPDNAANPQPETVAEPPQPAAEQDTTQIEQQSQNDSGADAAQEEQQDEATSDEQQSELPDVGEVTWSASEYIAHAKGSGWYVGLGLLIVLISAGVYFITRSIFSSIMVLVIGIAFGVVAARKPRTLQYTVDNIGVRIGDKGYPYSEIKSFSLVEDTAINSIQLVPFRRFMPPINIYFEAKDEDKILDIISNFVPHEEAGKDPIDHLMKRIKF
jgi:hypothetical protein